MVDLLLTNKTVLVTGANGHIGQQLVKALIEAQASVWALDISPLPTELSSRCEGELIVDLADSAKTEMTIRKKLSEIGLLAGVVHAAAFVGTSNLDGWLGGIEEQSRETFDVALGVNVGSVFTLVKELFPLLEGSSLVFISSIYGANGPDMSLYDGTAMDNPAAYGVSKSGLQQFSRYLSSRYGEIGLRANSILLGGVYRGQPESFVKKYTARTPLNRMATEQDVVGPVLFLLSDASSYISGVELPVDGGFLIR